MEQRGVWAGRAEDRCAHYMGEPDIRPAHPLPPDRSRCYLLPTFLLRAGSSIQQRHLRGHTGRWGISRSQPDLSPTHGSCLHPPSCPGTPKPDREPSFQGRDAGWAQHRAPTGSPRTLPTPIVAPAQDAQLVPMLWGGQQGFPG